ncbi:coactosin-like protein [Anneissia japonica]|uniref:coactosin-like protein n=1 Tax=Anneissia japonica TaxID=1529436 RepID=UPI001425A9AA|nr:coactosin-like protein [Anneissia japonica]
MVLQDKDNVVEAYEKVRSDTDETTWLICRYDGKEIAVSETGNDISELFSGDKLKNDERAFVYLRLETGDEMSRRAKFAFITWIGPEVSPIKKAKVSTDKAFVKQAIREFATEFMIDTHVDMNYTNIEQAVIKSSGANYGTGVR